MEAIVHGQDPSGTPGVVNVHTIDSSGNAWVAPQYHISDLDTSGDPMYFGYVDQSGNWYIMKLSPSSGIARYCKGSGGTIAYTSAWTARATQTYDYYSNVW
jgi:hypothetical protein